MFEEFKIDFDPPKFILPIFLWYLILRDKINSYL